MRRTLRLFASAGASAKAASSSSSSSAPRYLQAGAPTGLTGVLTHASPRSTLLYLYATTLDRLKAVPPHSLYRQSVEALTRHRMALVEAAVPPGYDAWAEQFARRLSEADPARFGAAAGRTDGARVWRAEHEGRVFVLHRTPEQIDDRQLEWDGEVVEHAEPEGTRSAEEKSDQAAFSSRSDLAESDLTAVEWESEPGLTADQVEELESKIGGGLIEEVISVAEGELNLIGKMMQSKVWEDLEEPPVEGQWTYFERKA